tara:strand:- start:23152 stop:24204 length:1053 start_codon:yes stop_codon:yes gene_type:complete
MSKVVIVTGSGGLVGSEVCLFFLNKGFEVVGIDNNMRSYFFGDRGSTDGMVSKLQDYDSYVHMNADIRDKDAIDQVFSRFNSDIDLVVHCAAQPSHDWAAKEPHTDFGVNAVGTMNMLEAYRQHSPEASFIFTSTNKVYGDRPNIFEYEELETRYEAPLRSEFYQGFDETLSIDNSTHSIFGASKVAADVMVQEYGRYFDLNTACFRGGCLTGPCHSGVELHGFLSYLVKCVVHGKPYTVFGYKGKQVRDNIHSHDLATAFYEFYKNPRSGEVYNIGGSRYSNCSMLEAISMAEEFSGKKLDYSYQEQNRVGDHLWWISDTSKFETHYPNWQRQYDIKAIIQDIVRSETE